MKDETRDERVLFPGESVVRTQHFDVHQDWEVPIPGFFIVAPVRSMKSIDKFSDEEAVEFINIVRRLRKGMRDILAIEEVYFF